MRHALLGTLLLITATAGFGQQNRPSLTWEGDVDGTALLIIQGNRVTVDTQSTGRVARTSFRFNETLDARERIDVENRLGSARVRVIEQPRRANDFRAVVEIDSRGRGYERVSLDFYFDDRRGGGAVSRNGDDRYRDDDRYRANDQTRRNDRGYGAGSRSRNEDRYSAGNSTGMARWSGTVDNEVFVLLRGRQFFSTAVRGRTVYNQQTDITNPLPRRPVTVMIQDAQGRGQLEIAEQPDSSNNFTAKVRIVDPEGGAGAYSFTMAWDESGYNSGASPAQTFPGQTYPSQTSPSGGVLSPDGAGYGTNSGTYGSGVAGARWAGQVDGRVRVSFRGNQAYAQRLSGQEVYNEQASFGSAVPRRDVDIAINKLRGRGDVNVIQRPSANNNYTAVIEIDDKDGGADMYDIEIAWR
jgi:hypothetical protein